MVASGELFYHLLASLRRARPPPFCFSGSRNSARDGHGLVARRLQSGESRHGDLAADTAAGLDTAQHLVVWPWRRAGPIHNFPRNVFPILVNTVVGVKNVDPNLIRAPLDPRRARAPVLWRVCAPPGTTAVHNWCAPWPRRCWMALVAAELVGANSVLDS